MVEYDIVREDGEVIIKFDYDDFNLTPSIEDDPKHLKYLQEIIDIIPKNQNYVNNYKNINTGKIDTKGGNLHIGDNYEN